LETTSSGVLSSLSLIEGMSSSQKKGSSSSLSSISLSVSSSISVSSLGVSSSKNNIIDTLVLSQNIHSSSSTGVPILRITGNINRESEPRGTVMNTQAYLSLASLASRLIALKNNMGENMRFKMGDRIRCEVNGERLDYSILENSTLGDFITALNAFLGANLILATASLNSLHQLEINSQSDLLNLTFSTDAPLVYELFELQMVFPATILAGDIVSSKTFFTPAISTDLLSSLFDSNGEVLGLMNNDQITVNANVGGVPISQSRSLLFDSSSTSMQDLMNLIKDQLRLPLYVGEPQESSVSIGLDEGLTLGDPGCIVIRGLPGESFEIMGLEIRRKRWTNIFNGDGFNSNNSTTIFQEARDIGVYYDTLSVLNREGNSTLFDLEIIFTHYSIGVYNWELNPLGLEAILIRGGKGQIMRLPNGEFISTVESGLFAGVAFSGKPTFNFSIDFGSNDVNVPFINEKLMNLEELTELNSQWINY
jgi:hypothetical protein